MFYSFAIDSVLTITWMMCPTISCRRRNLGCTGRALSWPFNLSLSMLKVCSNSQWLKRLKTAFFTMVLVFSWLHLATRKKTSTRKIGLRASTVREETEQSGCIHLHCRRMLLTLLSLWKLQPKLNDQAFVTYHYSDSQSEQSSVSPSRLPLP